MPNRELSDFLLQRFKNPTEQCILIFEIKHGDSGNIGAQLHRSKIFVRQILRRLGSINPKEPLSIGIVFDQIGPKHAAGGPILRADYAVFEYQFFEQFGDYMNSRTPYLERGMGRIIGLTLGQNNVTCNIDYKCESTSGEIDVLAIGRWDSLEALLVHLSRFGLAQRAK